MNRNKNKKKINSKNYLDFIPAHSDMHRYEIDEDGSVTIFKENKGVFNWIAQKLFHRPRISQIHLDKMGNFIWPLMDGKNTLQDIALCVKERFGEEAEPLYERLIVYIQNLESYGFIRLDSRE